MLIQKAAVHIAERSKELCDTQSRAPDSIAGASIYMACAAAGERKPMKGKPPTFFAFSTSRRLLADIQVVAGVMENTIRVIYRLMLPRAAELFPADFNFKCPVANLPTS